MHTVRRLYLYLMSGVTLGILIFGLRTVLVVVFDAIGLQRGSAVTSDPVSDRQQLSLAVALIGVGLPVWAVHWGLAQRGLRPAAAQAEEERGSTVRALYLTVVLGSLLAVGAGAAIELVQGLFQQILGAPAEFGTPDLAGGLASVLVAGLAWAYHVSVRRRDMRVGPLTGAAAWLPRVYLYGAALGGLFSALFGVESLLTTIGESVLPLNGTLNDPSLNGFLAAGSLAGILVGSTIWLGHWWYAARLVGDASWRGASERPAKLRLAYFVSVIVVATFSVIRLCAAAATAGLTPLFGATSPLGSGEELTGRDVAHIAGVALFSALPWAIAWVLHRRSMAREASASEDPQRVATVVRLDQHANALVGLAFGAVGFGWLLGLLVDLVIGGDRTTSEIGRGELSSFAPIALIGSTIWLWWWRRIQARYRANASTESAATVRRSYLLIVLAASVIASVGSAALILYRLFGALLGANLGGNPASELSTPIGTLVVAGVIALYHGQLLRRDGALHPTEAEPAPAEGAPATTGRALVLVGPSGPELDAAVTAVRAALPAGYRLDDA